MEQGPVTRKCLPSTLPWFRHRYSISLICISRAFQKRLLLPSTEISREVVKEVVFEVAVGLCDVTESAAPTGVTELEPIVEVATLEWIMVKFIIHESSAHQIAEHDIEAVSVLFEPQQQHFSPPLYRHIVRYCRESSFTKARRRKTSVPVPG